MPRTQAPRLFTFENDFHLCRAAVDRHFFALALLLKKHNCVKAYRNFRQGLARLRAVTPLDNAWISVYDEQTKRGMNTVFERLYTDLTPSKSCAGSLAQLRAKIIYYSRYVHAIYHDYMMGLQNSSMDYCRMFLLRTADELVEPFI